jgi:hypothetical protein
MFSIEEWRHVFVVRHNWAAAFAGTEVAEGEIIAPYERCVFEFKYSDHPLIVLHDSQSGGPTNEVVFAELGDCWFALGRPDDELSSLLVDIGAQIRAICISLDAEVTTTEVVRAPAKLNQKRAKNGLPLLVDYHVVDLSRRHRIANPAHGGEEPSHHKRLHFVRGHWRHFESHKTWVKWHLRGDPNLGFIDKHYSL